MYAHRLNLERAAPCSRLLFGHAKTLERMQGAATSAQSKTNKSGHSTSAPVFGNGAPISSACPFQIQACTGELSPFLRDDPKNESNEQRKCRALEREAANVMTDEWIAQRTALLTKERQHCIGSRGPWRAGETNQAQVGVME